MFFPLSSTLHYIPSAMFSFPVHFLSFSHDLSTSFSSFILFLSSFFPRFFSFYLFKAFFLTFFSPFHFPPHSLRYLLFSIFPSTSLFSLCFYVSLPTSPFRFLPSFILSLSLRSILFWYYFLIDFLLYACKLFIFRLFCCQKTTEENSLRRIVISFFFQRQKIRLKKARFLGLKNKRVATNRLSLITMEKCRKMLLYTLPPSCFDFLHYPFLSFRLLV